MSKKTMPSAARLVLVVGLAGCGSETGAAAGDASTLLPLDAAHDAGALTDAAIPVPDGDATVEDATACENARSEDGAAEPTICGCTIEDALDATGAASATVTFGNKYTPRCLLVSAGATVTWEGNFVAHPLWPSACAGDVDDNPIHDVPDLNDTTLSIAFPRPGTFPYYCPYHASDGRSPSGMCGVVFVAP